MHAPFTARRWWLSDGSEVDAQIARRVIEDQTVTNVGDSLFGFTPAQTYRIVMEDRRDD
jgi:hypothetical protein